jgi:alkaline phosphatase
MQGTDIMFGGGRHFFLPKGNKDSKRVDDRNVMEEVPVDLQMLVSSCWLTNTMQKAWFTEAL